jgi:glutathione S-transferase
MLTLIQFPWSPFCITIRHILTSHRIPFRLRNTVYHDRAPIITAMKGRGHTVPCLIDEKRRICDVTDFWQEVAHYVDQHYRLNLFPKTSMGCS